MTFRSSRSIAAAQSRASGRGCACIRTSIASYAWPEAKMPTLAVVAAGSSPRSRSSARARIARSRAASGVASSRGTPAPTCAVIRGSRAA